MVNFKSLFGVERHQIKKICVLVPVISKSMIESFKIKKFKKAMPYSCGNNDRLTLVNTHIGAPFAGDAVLYLKDTPCENIILFGSCGLVKKNPPLDIGSTLLIESCYSLESFSSLLRSPLNAGVSKSDKILFKGLLRQHKNNGLYASKCATFGSLKLEEDFRDYLIKKNISALDMECSAVFNAASETGKKAAALFYVTDILKEKHVLRALPKDEKNKIRQAMEHGISMIMSFAGAF